MRLGKSGFRRELLCLPCWAALWSLALSETLYSAYRRWLTDKLTPPAAKVRSTIGGQAEGGKYLLRLRLATVEEKYPWYDVRSNSSGWVLQYTKTKNYKPQLWTDVCVRYVFPVRPATRRRALPEFVVSLCGGQGHNNFNAQCGTHPFYTPHPVGAWSVPRPKHIWSSSSELAFLLKKLCSL